MAEEIGLTVRVTTVAEPGAMDRLKNETARSVQQGATAGAKNVKVPPPLQKFQGTSQPGQGRGGPVEKSIEKLIGKLPGGSSIMGGIEGLLPGLGGAGGAGGASGAGGAGGGAAAAGGVAMVAMLGIEVLKGIMAILQQIFQRLVEASPSLKAMVKMLNTGFNMIIKPIGDAIGYLLRPIARFFIVIGRNVNMAMAEKVAELQGQGYSSFGISGAMIASLPEIYLKVLVDAFKGIDWDSMINEWARVVTTNFTERIPSLISLIITVFASLTMELSTWFWGEVGKSLSALWSTISRALGGLGSWLWGGITSALNGAWGAVSGFGTWLWDGITGALGAAWGAVAGFGNWLWTSITGAIGSLGSALGGLGDWLWKSITSALSGTWNAVLDLGSWLWTSMTGALSGIGNAIGGFGTWLWNGITSALNGAWGAVSGFGTWLWTSITKAIGSLGSILGGFGSWLWNGIKGAIGSIGNLGSQLASEIKKFFHNAIAALINSIRNWDSGLPILGKPFTGLPSIAYLAAGGITNGPTLAMIGEGRGGREREVVSPLSQLPRLLGLDKQQQQAAMPPKIEIHIHGNVNGVDDLNRAIERGIDRYAYRLRGI